jgi:AcrR family transcriptional regulator
LNQHAVDNGHTDPDDSGQVQGGGAPIHTSMYGKGVGQVNTYVYGCNVDVQRLTKSDWIDHGLRTLRNEGANALKVGPMATKLNLSRGSFYWHFKDIADFRTQLLQTWQARTTDQVIAELEVRKGQSDRLRHLMRRGFGVNKLDRAVRSWATEDKDIAKVVAANDARRVAYIEGMLVAAGVPHGRALVRANFLYWAYLGQSFVMDPAHATIAPSDMDDISDLFAT